VGVLPCFRQVIKWVDEARIYTESSYGHEKHSDGANISLDSAGHPLIRATSVEDVLFGQGYVHARDRLFQMDFDRMRALGRLSEFYGEQWLSSDFMARAHNFSGQANEDWLAHDEVGKAHLQSFADGINAYLGEKHSLPLEYLAMGMNESSIEFWHPTHSLAILRYFASASSESWELELTRTLVSEMSGGSDLLGVLGLDDEDSALDEDTFLPSISSSAAWVLSGTHTASGRPILSTTLNLEPTAPGALVQNTLVVQGHMHVVGSSIPGVPFVYTGRNENISWSFLPSGLDTEDLFDERIDSVNTSNGIRWQYLQEIAAVETMECAPSNTAAECDTKVREVWADVEVKVEMMKVKENRGRGVVEELPLTLMRTVRGVVVTPMLASVSGSHLQASKRHLALSTVASRHRMDMSALYALNTAATWDDFLEGVERIEAMSLNALYADSSGNIGRTVTGRVPMRAKGHSGHLVSNGVVGEWIGDESAVDADRYTHHPLRRLNPPSGVLGSLPFHMDPKNPLVIAINSALEGSNATLDSIRELECSTSSPSSVALSKLIRRSLQENVWPNGFSDRVLKILGDQDGEDDYLVTSRKPLLLEAFRVQLADLLLDPMHSTALAVRGEAHSPFKRSTMLSSNFDWIGTMLSVNSSPAVERWMEVLGGRGAVIRNALMDAMEWVDARTSSWVSYSYWGDMHGARFAHSLSELEYIGEFLSPGPVTLSGGAWDAPRKTGTDTTTNNHNQDGFGCSLGRHGGSRRCRLTVHRSLFDLSSPKLSYVVNPPGPSGRIGSPHYNSVLSLWAKCELLPIIWTEDDSSESFHVSPFHEVDKNVGDNSEL